jgi:hypothetical protein
MANEFLITDVEGLHKVNSFVRNHFNSGGVPLKLVATKKNNGTMPMLSLWRLWMSEIAKYQADRGATMPIKVPTTNPDGTLNSKVIGSRPFDAKDAHEAYSALCLGSDETGNRYSWAVNSDEYQGRKVASIGQKLHAMQKFHHFCVEHGIKITIPDNSEYNNLQREQNG